MLDVLGRSLEQLPAGMDIPVLGPRARAFEVDVRPPGSKSLTNRAILLAALGEGRSVIHNALHDAEDARVMVRAVEAMGARVVERAAGELEVMGVGGRWLVPHAGLSLDVGGAGTAARFLAAAALHSPGPITLDGSPRMRERPMGGLGDPLSKLGARVEWLGKENCLPVRVVPPEGPIEAPGVLDLAGGASSQFVSALLLAAPWLATPLTLRLGGSIPSASYITMTLGLLGKLGATVKSSDNMRVLRVTGPRHDGVRGLKAFEYEVEPDASGATYFWGAAAINPGACCRVPGLGEDSLQGDALFPALLERMGCKVARKTPARGGAIENGGPARFIECRGPATLKPILADMGDMPDAAMTLAVVACFAGGSSILRGVRTLRVKASDRIAARAAELAKVGVKVVSPVAGDEDVMTITPPEGGLDTSPDVSPVEFETYEDHRMAMSLALIGLRRPGVRILNPRCVAKTYPEFWKHLALLHG